MWKNTSWDHHGQDIFYTKKETQLKICDISVFFYGILGPALKHTFYGYCSVYVQYYTLAPSVKCFLFLKFGVNAEIKGLLNTGRYSDDMANKCNTICCFFPH